MANGENLKLLGPGRYQVTFPTTAVATKAMFDLAPAAQMSVPIQHPNGQVTLGFTLVGRSYFWDLAQGTPERKGLTPLILVLGGVACASAGAAIMAGLLTHQYKRLGARR